jgi:hypothetical protein
MPRLLAPWPLLTLLVAAGCGTPFQASRSLALTAAWNQYERVEVRVRSGGVDLSSTEAPDVQITGQLRAGGSSLSEAEANLDQLEVYAGPDADNATTLLVELRYPLALQNKTVGASLVIRLPQACAARIRTSNGTIQVARMRDDVDAKSSNGRVQVEDMTGHVRAVTSNGAVDLRNITGDVQAESSNGRIRAEQITGNCVLHTSNGSINCDVAPPGDGHVELDTSNGGISLTLPRDLGANLDASTSNGRVKLELGDVPLKNVDAGRSRLRATMNVGGCRVTARTSNGSIALSSR